MRGSFVLLAPGVHSVNPHDGSSGVDFTKSTDSFLDPLPLRPPFTRHPAPCTKALAPSLSHRGPAPRPVRPGPQFTSALLSLSLAYYPSHVLSSTRLPSPGLPVCQPTSDSPCPAPGTELVVAVPAPAPRPPQRETTHCASCSQWGQASEEGAAHFMALNVHVPGE